MELVKEKWVNRVNAVTIGATKEEGGTRRSKVSIGGESVLPFLFDEGEMPHPPVIAMEVLDNEPADWPAVLKEPFGDVLGNPVDWAQRCVKEFKAKIICLKLQSIHPDFGDTPADKAAELVKALLNKIEVPLIILGCGDDEKDNIVLAKCREIARVENCLIVHENQDNYKKLKARKC